MTIDIQTVKGDLFQFDTDTELIYRNGSVVPRTDYEPVFLNHINPNVPPTLSGILIVKENKVISKSGRINQLVDINLITI